MTWFEGMCDASGSVPLDEQHFLVVDDEDNLLRVYDADRGGPPQHTHDVSSELPLAKPKAEADLEAVTRIGDEAYYLASHGRKRSGKRDNNRLLFFATTLPASDKAPHVVGAATSLLDAFERAPALADFGLSEAATRAPTAENGLNLEGMTAAGDGSVWIGFRNPVPRGRALLVRLENPREVVRGQAPRLGKPLLLDLGGLGIRALTTWRGQQLLIAGPSGSGGPFRLYRFSRDAGAELVAGVDFEGFGPEGFFSSEGRDELLILSDDGTRIIDGVPCKQLVDPRRKRFPGLWLRLPSPAQKAG